MGVEQALKTIAYGVASYKVKNSRMADKTRAIQN
jgi:hypothetical protein